jgi:hypothetical protein
MAVCLAKKNESLRGGDCYKDGETLENVKMGVGPASFG